MVVRRKIFTFKDLKILAKQDCVLFYFQGKFTIWVVGF